MKQALDFCTDTNDHRATQARCCDIFHTTYNKFLSLEKTGKMSRAEFNC